MSFLLTTGQGGNFNLALNDGGVLPVQDSANVGPGTGPNPATQQTAWFQDYVNGNDNNDGKTAATAVKTAAEIKRRWTGGIAGARVQLPAITITITALSNVAANSFSDPWAVLLDVDQVGGGQLILQGTALPASHSGTLATASAFARTSAAGQIVITDAGVPDWHALGVPSLFVDTTSNGVGWLYEPQSASSANGIISPCRGPASPGTTTDGGQVTVSATNTYQLVPLVQIYMGSGAKYRCFPAQPTGATALATIRRLQCVQAAAFEVMRIEPQESAGVYWQEGRSDAQLIATNFTVVQNWWSTTFMSASQTLNNTNPFFYSGGSYSAITVGQGQVIVDRDYVLDTVNGGTAFFFARGVGSFLRMGQVSSWGLTTAFSATSGCLIRIAGLNGSGDVYYGNVGAHPIFNLSMNATLEAHAADGTFASAFNFNRTDFNMNSVDGSTTGFGFSGTGTYVGPTTYTTAHVDAALAAGTGFGTAAWDPRTGASASSFNG